MRPARGQRVDVDEQQAVESVLADLGNAARLDLLAQDHAEDGRFRRVFEVLLEQVGRRVLRVDGDVQQEILPGLTHGQDDGLLIGLCDLVDAAARERVFLVRRDIGLLPGKAPVVKDQLTGLADIVVARGPGPVAVRDGQHRGLRPFAADGKVNDAALRAVCEREGIAVQAERHLHAVFRHTQRLVQRPVLRQIIAAAFQLPAAHRQRLESRFLTGVLAVDCVDVRAVRRRFPEIADHFGGALPTDQFR